MFSPYHLPQIPTFAYIGLTDFSSFRWHSINTANRSRMSTIPPPARSRRRFIFRLKRGRSAECISDQVVGPPARREACVKSENSLAPAIRDATDLTILPATRQASPPFEAISLFEKLSLFGGCGRIGHFVQAPIKNYRDLSARCAPPPALRLLKLDCLSLTPDV